MVSANLMLKIINLVLCFISSPSLFPNVCVVCCEEMKEQSQVIRQEFQGKVREM